MRIPRTDLDLAETLLSGQTFRFREVGPGHWEGWDGASRFAFRLNGETIEAAGDEVALRLFLGLDRGNVFGQLVARGPELAPIVADLGSGFRRLYPSDFNEVVFSFLCSANNHLGRITAMVERLASRGTEGRFPDLDVLQSLDAATLAKEGFGYRAPRVAMVAKTLIEYGPEWPRWLKTLGPDSCRKQLETLEGVGPKVADCIAMYGLHRDDVAPMDTHLWQAVRRVYYPHLTTMNPSASQVEEAQQMLRERFGNLCADAHLLLYRSNQKNAENRKNRKID